MSEQSTDNNTWHELEPGHLVTFLLSTFKFEVEVRSYKRVYSNFQCFELDTLARGYLDGALRESFQAWGSDSASDAKAYMSKMLNDAKGGF